MIKKLSLLYLICTILILLGLGGFVWYGMKHLPTNNPINTNQNVDTNEVSQSGQVVPPTKTDCADELDTECWNTYRNDEYGFSFKFPAKFYLNDYGDEYGIIMDEEELPKEILPGDMPYALVVFIKEVTITDYLPTLPGLISQNSLVIGTNDVIDIKYYSDMFDKELHSYYISHDGFTICLSGDTNMEDLFSIIRSFKFSTV